MKITFGDGWFRAKKCLTQTWNEERAKEAHDKRKLYVAVVGEVSSPVCFVEFNDNYVGVGFLDELQREYLSYAFDEVEPGRLFLKQATHREFDDDSDKVSRGKTFFFKKDGSVRIENGDLLQNSHSIAETKADVAGNWETYPSFGQYEEIVREDR